MKNTHLLLSIVILMWTTSVSIGQQHHYNWKLGIHTGVATYFGDLSYQFWDLPHQFSQPIKNANFLSYGLSLEHHFSKVVGFKLMLSRHQITASDRTYEASNNYYRALNVQTDLYEAGLLTSIYLDNGRIFGEKAVFSPYFLIGGGLTYFVPKGDLLSSSGNQYHYWSDKTIRTMSEQDPNAANATIINQDFEYETALRPLITEGNNYTQFTWNLALGLGFKFRLSKRFHLHLEAIIRYTGSDFIDDVSADYLPSYADNFQAYAANPSNVNRSQRASSPDMNDWYSTVGLSLHYSFGQKTFNIEPSIIYTNYQPLIKDSSNLVVSKNDTVVTKENLNVPDTITIKEDTVIEEDIVIKENTVIEEDSVIKEDITVEKNIVNTDSLDKTPSIIIRDTIVETSINPTTGDTIIKELVTEEIIYEQPDKKTSSIGKETIVKQQTVNQNDSINLSHKYELLLLEQKYEAKLKEKELLNTIELQKTNPDAAAKKIEKDYEQKIRAYEKKLLEQGYQNQLNELKLSNDNLLEKKEHSHENNIHDYELKLQEQNNQHQLELLKLQHQLELEKLRNNLAPPQPNTIQGSKDTIWIERTPSTGAVDLPQEDVNTNSETKALVGVDSTDVEILKVNNEILKLRIQELEIDKRALAKQKNKSDTVQIIKVDSIYVNPSKSDINSTAEKNIALQKQIDSLTAALNLLQKQHSNELQNFLNKQNSTYITKIYFDAGKSSLTIQAKETLNTLISHLESYPDIAFGIKGFASKTGNSVTNERLSRERASEVANYIKQSTKNNPKVEVFSLGDKESTSSNELDRRAEVHLYWK